MTGAQLVDLKVLLVGDDPDRSQNFRLLLSSAGVPSMDTAHNDEEGLSKLAIQRYDMIFFDIDGDDAEMQSFVFAARRNPANLNPMVPIFALMREPIKKSVEFARDQGIYNILVWPISSATVATKLSRAITSPRPFIVGTTFFGPDRRNKLTPSPVKTERRKRNPRKVKIAVELGDASES